MFISNEWDIDTVFSAETQVFTKLFFIVFYIVKKTKIRKFKLLEKKKSDFYINLFDKS